jgi:hypothetical protein
MLSLERPKRIALLVAMLFTSPFSRATEVVVPELPRVYVDTKYVRPTGATIKVAAGGDLQAAFNRAKPGDTIALPAGAEFVGNFELTEKSGYVHVVTESLDVPPGTRVKPEDAAKMAKIRTPNAFPAIQTKHRASFWRFIGVEITNSRANLVTTNIVQLQPGGKMTGPDDMPHHIIFDRVYIHGNPGDKARRGIRQGGRHQAVIDSYISDIRQPGFDTQAISDSQGPGPYKVTNSFLEATTENIGYGGSNPWFKGSVPCDIEIVGNHIFKPLSWQTMPPDELGLKPLIKNWIEFKAGCRVLVESNIFENNWLQAQAGFGVVLTPQNGSAPNLAEEEDCIYDLTFRNNIFRNTPAALNIRGRSAKRCGATRITFNNNLFELKGTIPNGRMIQYLSGPKDISFIGNTFYAPDTTSVITAGGTPTVDLIFRDNIAFWGKYGFIPTKYAEAFGPAETIGERISGNIFIRANPAAKATAKRAAAKPAPMLSANTFVPTFEDAVRSGKGVNRTAMSKATARASDGGR